MLELSRQSCFKSCDHIISGSNGRKLKQNSKNTCNDVDFQASGSDFFLNGRVLKWNSTHKVLLASLLLPEYRSKSVAAHRWSQLLLILLLMPAEAPIVQVAPPLANKCPALEGFWASPRFKSPHGPFYFCISLLTWCTGNDWSCCSVISLLWVSNFRWKAQFSCARAESEKSTSLCTSCFKCTLQSIWWCRHALVFTRSISVYTWSITVRVVLVL